MGDVRTVNKLGLPMQSMNVTSLKHQFGHLKNLPLQEYQNAVPRIFIGIAHWALGLPLESRESRLGGPIAAKYRLGWTVSGKIGDSDQLEFAHYHLCEVLQRQVKDFFSLENFGVRKSDFIHESTEERRGREMMQKNTIRIGDRFVTGLLWRHDTVEFHDSRAMVMRRMHCLEKRIAKNTANGESL